MLALYGIWSTLTNRFQYPINVFSCRRGALEGRKLGNGISGQIHWLLGSRQFVQQGTLCYFRITHWLGLGTVSVLWIQVHSITRKCEMKIVAILAQESQCWRWSINLCEVEEPAKIAPRCEGYSPEPSAWWDLGWDKHNAQQGPRLCPGNACRQWPMWPQELVRATLRQGLWQSGRDPGFTPCLLSCLQLFNSSTHLQLTFQPTTSTYYFPWTL